MGTGCYLYKVYNYHDSRACVYKQSGIHARIEGMELDVEWSGFGLALWNCMIYRSSLWIIL
jgi:hypothetical protein